MQPEISELLREAVRDAPPPRYDVDDAVKAGRRRQHRRRAGVVIAAVVAVAAAIGVPQITTHRADHPITPVVTPTLQPDDGTGRAEYRFRGYDAGDHHVNDPDTWTPVRQDAEIVDGGGVSVGELTVYPRGVAPDRGRSSERTPADPIGGRPAWTQSQEQLVWQYADNAYAVISPQTYVNQRPGDRATPEPPDFSWVRPVAEAFRMTAPYPVTLPFRVGYVPADFRLTWVDTRALDYSYETSVGFTRTAVARAWLKDPGRGPTGTPGDSYQVTFGGWTPISGTVPATRGKPRCIVRGTGRCDQTAGQFYLVASGSPTVESERIKMLGGMGPVAQPRDASSWIPIGEALPPSVLLDHP